MRIIIVDDEKASAEDIQRLLKKNFPAFTLVDTYNKLDEGVKGILEHQPDLIFLDVELDKTQTGFDLLEKINPRTFEVIFMTGHNKYAVRAFQYSALHYLQKPVDEGLFIQAVNRAIETKQTKEFTQRIDVMLNSMRQAQPVPQKIMVSNLKSDGWLCLDVSDILRVDSDGKDMVKITYREEGEYLFTGLSKSIGEVEKMLQGHDFIRVHESHLVNPAHIKLFKRHSQVVVMADKKEVEVSRRNVNLLMEKIRKL